MKGDNNFQIRLNDNFFRKGDLMFTPDGVKVKVIGEPKTHYKKWYWKILYYITFKRLFVYTAEYTVEIL